MPNLIRRMLRQKAILWEFTGEDKFGAKRYRPPVEIPVRWEEKTEEFLDLKGNRQISRAQVFVDRRIEERSVLWQGSFDEVELAEDAKGNPNPFVNEGAFEVRQFAEQPDFKAKRFLRYVYL